MKTYRWVLTAIAAASLALVGCKKENNVDTAQLEASFKTAEPENKNSADKIVTSIKSSDYSGALAELKTLGSKAKLTPEQQQAIKDNVSQVETAVKDAASKVADDAKKGLEKLSDGAKNAADDAKKALSK